MKAIAVNGITKSGKTTVCETLIRGLRKRGYSVGSVKEIHFEEFRIDPNPNTNTNRHKDAGSQLVSARGLFETDFLFQSMLPIDQILSYYDHDFVVLEGVTDCNCCRIITAHNEQEIIERMDANVIGISGVFANSGIREFENMPVYNVLNEPDALLDLVLEKAFEPLPDVDPKCCSACGYSCRTLAQRILANESTRGDCVLTSQDVELSINGRPVKMVPFVQRLLKNAVIGVASELSGFMENSEIVVKVRQR